MENKRIEKTKSIVTIENLSSPDISSEDNWGYSSPLENEVFSIESHWSFKLIGWFGFLFWSTLIIAFVRANGLNTSINTLGIFIFGSMLLLSIFLLLMARQSVFIDKKQIVIIRLIGRYRINWDEIVKIEFDTMLHRVVFYGKDKWLVMPRISAFVSGRRIGLVEYVNALVEIKKIPIGFSEYVPEKSKNTMISYF